MRVFLGTTGMRVCKPRGTPALNMVAPSNRLGVHGTKSRRSGLAMPMSSILLEKVWSGGCHHPWTSGSSFLNMDSHQPLSRGLPGLQPGVGCIISPSEAQRKPLRSPASWTERFPRLSSLKTVTVDYPASDGVSRPANSLKIVYTSCWCCSSREHKVLMT